jgi:Ca2+-binding RTX toxin-like protein
MRGLVAAGVTAAAAVFAATPATAAIVVRDDVDSADVTFTADPGEANRVVVREEAGGFRFVDTGAVLTTRTCTLVNAHEVFCPGIAETLIVEVVDGDDFVDVSGAPIALVDGGDGDDELVAAFAAGGEGADVLRGIGLQGRLRGGPGDDTILGGPGNDILAIDGGSDRLDGGRGNDSYVLDTGARGIAATIADSGGDPRDSISLTCKGVRLTTASRGTRERRGRYALPNGTVSFAGLDGALPCTLPRVVGLTLARARRALAAAGFRVGKVTYRRSAKVRRGRVISQRRLASTVSLVVSSGAGGSG